MQTGKGDASIDWGRVQGVKRECLRLAAQHALEQQKRDQRPTVDIPFPAEIADGPKMQVAVKGPESLRVAMTGVLTPYGQAQEDTVWFRLDRPLNLLEGGSGLAVIAETAPGASREVRLGVRLIATGGQKSATILPYVAALSLEPEDRGRTLFVTLHVLRGTVPYEHQFATPQVN